MKMKNILMMVMVGLVGQSLVAAEFTLYNKSDDSTLAVSVGVNSQDFLPQIHFKPGVKKTQVRVNGSFREIVWQIGSKVYRAFIPSTSGMLMGTIDINNNGRYSINFDANGASDKKVRQLVGVPY